MIQVKEFLNYQEGQDTIINDWIKQQGNNIEIIDIKYSVGMFHSSQEFSGVLIVYSKIN